MNPLCLPENITVSFHPHPLRLKDAHETVPYDCVGCKEKGLGKYYQCENCDYHLHQQCYDLSESGYSSSIKFTFLESKKCDFVFQKEAVPERGQRACDACGKDVKGWFCGCKVCKKPHYLHPCCAHLPFKKTDKDGMVLDLKEKASSVCIICENKGHSRDFKSWVYVFRGGKYCYHVSCVKGKYEEWKRNEASNQQQSYGDGTSSEACVSRGEVLNFLEMAVDIFNFVVFLIFGVAVPLPFGLVIKWLKRTS